MAESASLEASNTRESKLLGVGSKKVNLIKVVRALTGMGLKESKDLRLTRRRRSSSVMRPPQVVTAGETHLKNAGATAKVTCGVSPL